MRLPLFMPAGALFAAGRSRRQYSGPAGGQRRGGRMSETGRRYFLNFMDILPYFIAAGPNSRRSGAKSI